MYKVVEFLDNEGGGISIIRQTWLTPRKRHCMWPPHKLMAKFNKCLIGKEIPDDTWEIYAVKRVFYETDNLNKAREKAKKAENESDIASENDMLVRRRKTTKNYDSDTSETGSDDLISYPTPPGTKVVTNAIIELPPTSITTTDEEFNIQGEHSLASSFSGSKKKTKDTSEKISESSLSTSLGLLDVTVTPFLNELGSNNSQALDVIAKHLARIQIDIQELKNSQDEIVLRLRSSTAVLQQYSLPEDISHLMPCDSQEVLATLEKWLSTSENAKLMVTSLSFIGGNKIPTIIRRILEKLFTNKLALTFNWTGKNNKTALRNLNLMSILRDAVRLNKVAEKATDAEINEIISNWFRFTKDRNGGREARRISQV